MADISHLYDFDLYIGHFVSPFDYFKKALFDSELSQGRLVGDLKVVEFTREVLPVHLHIFHT